MGILSVGQYLTLLHLCINSLALGRYLSPRSDAGLTVNKPTSDRLAKLTDDELIAICQKKGFKDERPFRELWRRHYLTVWRTCFRYFPNEDDVEDLTQEIFIKAFRSIKKFEGRAAFKTWITRIAVNSCYNEIRRRKARADQFAADIDSEVEETALMAATEPVENQVEIKLRMELLTAAIRQLDPEEWQIIYLKDVEGRSYDEISAEFGIGISAAKMRVQRTRQKIMRLMQGVTPVLEGDS